MRATFARLLVPASMAFLSVSALAQGGGTDPDYGSQGTGGGTGAPEISPNLLVAGAVLLIGGTLILIANRRHRHATN